MKWSAVSLFGLASFLCFSLARAEDVPKDNTLHPSGAKTNAVAKGLSAKSKELLTRSQTETRQVRISLKPQGSISGVVKSVGDDAVTVEFKAKPSNELTETNIPISQIEHVTLADTTPHPPTTQTAPKHAPKKHGT